MRELGTPLLFGCSPQIFPCMFPCNSAVGGGSGIFPQGFEKAELYVPTAAHLPL
jgi:hypothetical protein